MIFYGTLIHRMAQYRQPPILLDTVLAYNMSFTGTIIAISALMLLLTVIFVAGVIKKKKRWLIPLILSMICVCVASLGTFIAIMMTIADDVHEEFLKHPHNRIVIIANTVFLR